MGIREGIMLREYIDTRAQKAEEAKLRAQLYGSQAKHYEAQNALLQMNLTKEQEFMRGLPQALMGGQPSPATSTPSGPAPGELDLPRPGLQAPGFSTQPYSAGPQAPGAMSTARLHDTQAFLDPTEGILDRLGMLALRTGQVGDYAKIQQGMIERQKVRTTARQQQLQDQLGLLQEIEGTLSPGNPLDAPKRALLRNAKAALMGQLGKTNDMLQMLEGKTLAVQPGGSVFQQLPGEPTGREVFRSPVSPATLTAQKEQAALNVRAGQPPLTGTATAGDVRKLEEQKRIEAGLMPPATPGVEAGPPAGQIRYTGTLDGTPMIIDAWSEPHAQQLLALQFPGRQIVLTPQAPPVGGRAALAGQAEAARLQAQGLQPTTPTRPVPQQRAEAELRAQGLEPGQPSRSIPQQRAAIEFAYQHLGVEEQTKLVPLLQSANIIDDILRVPETQAQTYIGLLRRPKTGVENLLADIVKAGAGDPERERFLANIKQLFYMLNRPDVGANFTSVEKEWIADAYPHGTELTYTAWKAKMDRLVPMLQDKLGILTGVMTTPRGQIPTKIRQLQGKKPETPEEIEDRIRQQRGYPPRRP